MLTQPSRDVIREALVDMEYVYSAHYDGAPEALAKAAAARAALAELDALPALPQPDWSTAPEWAMWWAINGNGWAAWYRAEPYCDDDEGVCWCPQFVDLSKYDKHIAIPIGIDWRATLQPRPAREGE